LFLEKKKRTPLVGRTSPGGHLSVISILHTVLVLKWPQLVHVLSATEWTYIGDSQTFVPRRAEQNLKATKYETMESNVQGPDRHHSTLESRH
jgi:hypothetical protein